MLLINHRPISIWFFIMKIIALVLLLSFAQESQAKGIFSKLKEFKSRIIKGKKSKNLPSTSVLFLGDSMSMGAFGSTLDSKLRDAGFEVHTYVAGGATPYYWLSQYQSISSDIGFWEKTPKLERRLKKIEEVPKVEDLLNHCDPDIVVVQTGTNLYSSLRSKRREESDNIKLVQNLCRDMAEAASKGGRRCSSSGRRRLHLSCSYTGRSSARQRAATTCACCTAWASAPSAPAATASTTRFQSGRRAASRRCVRRSKRTTSRCPFCARGATARSSRRSGASLSRQPRPQASRSL